MMLHPRLTLAAAMLTTLLLGTGTVAKADTERWVIDDSHASIGFMVDHIGFARQLGMFLEIEGSFEYDPDTMHLESGRVTIPTDSVFTNHDKRDEHLRDPDFFDTGTHPFMIFTATDFEPTGERQGRLTGDLELLGRRNPVTLDVTINRIDEYPFSPGLFRARPYVLGASLRGTLRRSDWGMDYGVDDGLVGDEVELILEVEARRQ